MTKTIFLTLLACALLSWPACDNCNRIECKPNGEYVEMRLLRDGKNAVFGPDAFISRDSIKYSNLGPAGTEAYAVRFIDSTQTIKLFIEEIYVYQLKLGSIRTDTIEAVTSVIDYDQCCSTYELKYVYLNGEIVCLENCGEVVEVSL